MRRAIAPWESVVGIVGVTGYGGSEILRICVGHPTFELCYVAAEASAGHRLGDRFPGLRKYADLQIERWASEVVPDLDLLFVSLPTGKSADGVRRLPEHVKIVDVGGDHRFAAGWTYGLTELWPERIAASTRVADPGCYPAAALLALAPLVTTGLIHPTGLVVDAKSGISGAGRGGGSELGFADVNEDLVAYGLPQHPHLEEMRQVLCQLARREAGLSFTPHLVPMTRGLLATCYARGSIDTETAVAAARGFYAGRPFVRVVDQPPHTKWALGSNMAFVSYVAYPGSDTVVALCGIDNLGKGAAGQAVQNANLMTGLLETAGLEGAPLWP